MRSAHLIEAVGAEESYALQFDMRDIDAANPYSFWRLRYLERIHHVIRNVMKYCKRGEKVIEIGSAQANMTLLLAEMGYDCTAVDLRESFLTYSKKKYEKGEMTWILGNAFEQRFDSVFNAVLLCELLEHVAHPDDLVQRSLDLLAPGGILIMTTPNHRYFHAQEPSYEDARRDMQKLEANQFGPAGEHHLFSLTMDELRSLLPDQFEVLEEVYLDSILLSGTMQPLLNMPFPRSLLLSLNARLRTTPFLRDMCCGGLLMVVRRIT
jgi:2-polyprenyl-6-hydroxyphenyl methylase/3-demethylubiquinone-9 3-methyltransferase